MSNDPAPTFASNKDRLIWLLGEWKWPLLVLSLGMLVVLAWVRPEISVPNWLGAFALAWTILALPSWIVVYPQVDSLVGEPDGVSVGVVNPGHLDETQTAQSGLLAAAKWVPEEIWTEHTTVVGPSPIEPDDGNLDYVVTKWNWMPGVGELELRGAERGEMDPVEVLTATERVDEYYRFHHKYRRAFTKLKASVSRKMTEVHDATAMTILGDAEDAQLLDDVAVMDELEEADPDGLDLPEEPGAPAEKDNLDRLDEQFDDLDPSEMPGTGGPEPARADGGTHE